MDRIMEYQIQSQYKFLKIHVGQLRNHTEIVFLSKIHWLRRRI